MTKTQRATQGVSRRSLIGSLYDLKNLASDDNAKAVFGRSYIGQIQQDMNSVLNQARALGQADLDEVSRQAELIGLGDYIPENHK